MISTFKKNLQEIGIDSITFIRIIVELETAFNLEFEDEKLSFVAFNTIEDIIEYVKERVGVLNNDS